MKTKKMKGVEAIKEQYGWKCVSFWVVGLIIFFVYPLIQSIVYMFNETTLLENNPSRSNMIAMLSLNTKYNR